MLRTITTKTSYQKKCYYSYSGNILRNAVIYRKQALTLPSEKKTCKRSSGNYYDRHKAALDHIHVPINIVICYPRLFNTYRILHAVLGSCYFAAAVILWQTQKKNCAVKGGPLRIAKNCLLELNISHSSDVVQDAIFGSENRNHMNIWTRTAEERHKQTCLHVTSHRSCTKRRKIDTLKMGNNEICPR